MRWVCGLCLRVLDAPLTVSWKWSIDKVKNTEGRWVPNEVEEPRCHGHPMLVAGKPKLDIFGSGQVIDPVDNLRCPKLEILRA